MDVERQQDNPSIEITSIGAALSEMLSPFDPCEQCGRRRRHIDRKWCRSCILAWQRANPDEHRDRFRNAIVDACPNWREVIPERFWPADLSHLPEVLVKRIKALPDDRGLFLWGPQGAGKTWATVAAIKHLWTAGYNIAWQPFEELLLRLRDTYRGGVGSEWGIFEPLCKVEVLALDDVGCMISADRQESDFSLRTLLVLLDDRLAHCRRTFFTSNKAVEDLGKSFDARIASRLCEACDILKLAGRDRRADRARGGKGDE